MRMTDGDRSAAMQLGISTVVILVIAMVMIGAGISFIRTIFSSGEQVVVESVPSEDLTLNPTSENPFEMSQGQLEGRSGESKSFQVGVYNSETSSVSVNLTVDECRSPGISGNLKDAFDTATTSRTIDSSSSAGFKVIMEMPEAGDSTKITNVVDDSPYLCKITATATDGEFSRSRDITMSVIG